MEIIQGFLLLTTIFLKCNAVSYLEQLQHIMRNRRESQAIPIFRSRRFDMNPEQTSIILGAPSMPSHLPEAEAVLPGHTLIKPAVGMLKSAVKYPHLELENGAGVYGNINNLGIRYDGKNERVLYSGFRRMPRDYIVVIPTSSENFKIKEVLQQDRPMARTHNSRARRNKQKLLHKKEDNSEDSTSESQEEYKEYSINPTERPKKSKKNWFRDSKNAYNHIKVSPDAYELADLLPVENMVKRQDWWFFTQDDFVSFEE